MITDLPNRPAAAADAPIAAVTLRVSDAPRVARFWRDVIGLEELARDGTETVLGAGGRPLLTRVADAAATAPPPHAAGLFHIALLLPSRRDLGLWLRAAAERGVTLEGASDHLVSEAIYLSDPEGNGVEVYADRPRHAWAWADGKVVMATRPLDLRALAAAAPGKLPARAPEETVIGHVHLKVGDVAEAERFWSGIAGLEVSARYGGAAVFLARGGYHHHLAANAWSSRGAGRRAEGQRGLVAIALSDGLTAAVTDPWGNTAVPAPATLSRR